MTDSLFPHRFAGRAEEAKSLEAFETPEWCAEAILRRELLTPCVIDSCCGHGTLSKVAGRHGYKLMSSDLADWGFGREGIDFLATPIHGFFDDPDYWWSAVHHHCAPDDLSIFMNPPFSKAVEFVEHAWRGGVRKIVCFQRFAWWESLQRTRFWRE